MLRSILEPAVEYQHLTANPAVGRRRRLKPPVRRPVHLGNVDQLRTLLEAAGQLGHDPGWLMNDRRAKIAALVLAGPRVSEHSHLPWRAVDLANGRIETGRSKTAAGLR